MKTLLVRLSSMGDLVHTLPAVSDLAVHCPNVHLHWLAERSFADIARLHPFVRHVHEMQWRTWRKQWYRPSVWHRLTQLKQQLRAQQFERVIDAQGLYKSVAFARMAGASIMGLDRNSAREPWASIGYTQTFAVDKTRDAVWRNRHLMAQAFGYSFEGKANFGVVVPDSARVAGLPQHYRVALTATSREAKLWPNEHWIGLLKLCHAHDGLPVLLPWGNAVEHERVQHLAAAVPDALVCPRVNLMQAAWMLNGATSVVGVDTGLLHLANAVNKPVVGIYTHSNPELAGVQTSDNAHNLGYIGYVPNIEEVFSMLLSVEGKANATQEETA